MKTQCIFHRLVLAAAIVFGPGTVASSGRVRTTETDSFRSFTPENLVARKQEKRAPVASGWHATFHNTTGITVSTLELRFKSDVTLTGFAPFPDAAPLGDNRSWLVYGQELPDGDSLTVYGIGPADRTEISQWRYDGGAYQPGFIPFGQEFYLPMPNSANLRIETYQYGGFAPGVSTTDPIGGMLVGKSFLKFTNGGWRVNTDSSRVYGWVRLKRQSDVLRSLQRNKYSPIHSGPPRGFVTFDNGKRFFRQLNNLTTLKMDNRLFAELVALKMNIAASTLGILPAGFGELIYEDNGHPYDDRMIRDISKIADSLMTYSLGRDSSEYIMLDSVAHKINLAFSGPIDTLSFADSLVFSGVRSLSEVAFLRANADEPVLRLPRVYQPEFDESIEESDEEVAIPQLVTLARNYPNPFNPQTVIQFELAEPAIATMKIYDLLGQEVATLLNRELVYDGTNEVVFDAGGLSSGTYFYRISVSGFDNPDVNSVLTGKMLVIK